MDLQCPLATSSATRANATSPYWGPIKWEGLVNGMGPQSNR
jgi:hypothetical protein